jgi:hypothetical protein
VNASRTNLLERYDELVALTVTDIERRRAVFVEQGRVILALDGLQPDVGHEVSAVTQKSPGMVIQISPPSRLRRANDGC